MCAAWATVTAMQGLFLGFFWGVMTTESAVSWKALLGRWYIIGVCVDTFSLDLGNAATCIASGSKKGLDGVVDEDAGLSSSAKEGARRPALYQASEPKRGSRVEKSPVDVHEAEICGAHAAHIARKPKEIIKLNGLGKEGVLSCLTRSLKAIHGV